MAERKLRSDEVLQDGKIVRVRKNKEKKQEVAVADQQTVEINGQLFPVRMVDGKLVVDTDIKPDLIDQFRVQRNQPTGDAKYGRTETFIPQKRPNNLNQMLGGELCQGDSVKSDPSLGVRNPVPRGTREVVMVDVVCFKCGVKERVSPVLATSYSSVQSENTHKCENCILSGGR